MLITFKKKQNKIITTKMMRRYMYQMHYSKPVLKHAISCKVMTSQDTVKPAQKTTCI